MCLCVHAHMGKGLLPRVLKPTFESSWFKSSQPDCPENPLTSMLQSKSRDDGRVLLIAIAKFTKP